ncbi:MAG: LysR family transcriptional regulator [candidate division Zixibacteria bacterium]|nr:LysR family transcriptional regulator [candidate division Zixibacteria bacterium]
MLRKMKVLNYHHLHYFWTVAREGSLSRASAELRLAPSTLSAQIHALEDALERKLFQRKGRRLELTEMGHVVLRYADQIFALGQEMQTALSPRSGNGPLRLTAAIVDILPKLTARLLLEPALGLEEPVKLVVRDGKRSALLAALGRRELDIILTNAPIKGGRGNKLFNHFLGESAVGLYARTDLAIKYRRRFPQSLDGAPIVMPTMIAGLRSALDRWFTDHGIQPKIVGEFDDYTYILLFGQSGAGIFPAPAFASEEIQHRFGVNFIGTTPIVHWRYYAVTAEKAITHAAVRAICDAAQRALGSPTI